MEDYLKIERVSYGEIKKLFHRHLVWSDEQDLLWYSYAWHIYDKCGKNVYTTDIEHAEIILHAYTLITIYIEFCHIAYGMPIVYDFYITENEEGVTPYLLGRLVQKRLDEEAVSDIEATPMFIDQLRSDVLSILMGESGFLDEIHMLASLYASTMDSLDDYYTGNLTRPLEELEPYELLEIMITENFSDVMNDLTTEKRVVHSWLCQGTYRLK